MSSELEVIMTISGIPVYEFDGRPWTAPINQDDIWLSMQNPRSYRAKIILALLSAGF